MEHIRQRLIDNKGVSIIFALVLMLACTIACLSLFTITNSSVQHVRMEKDYEQAMILAQSLAEQTGSKIEEIVSGVPEDSLPRTFSCKLPEETKAQAEITIFWKEEKDFGETEESDPQKRTLCVTTCVTVREKETAQITQEYLF